MAASRSVRWVLRWGGVLVITGVTLCAASAILAWRWRQVPIGPGTTRISGPLAADGQVDYLAAINEQLSAGVTAENNAAPEVLRVVGMKDESPAWRATELRLLAMPDPGAGLLVGYAAWRKARGEAVDDADAFDQPLQAAAERVWTADESPKLAAYITSQKDALDALEIAVQRERFYVPVIMGDGATTTGDRPAILQAHILAQQPLRAAGNTLLARAMLRLGAGDATGFERDVRAADALSRLLVQQPSVIEYLVARAANDAVLRTLQVAATSDQLDPATAGRLRAALAAAPWPRPVPHIDGYQRYMILDVLVDLSEGQAVSYPEPRGIPLVPIHFALALTEANEFVDRQLDAWKIAIFADRQRALLAIDRDARARTSSGTARSPTVLGAMLIPSWVSLNEIVTERDAQEHLALTALGLRVYQAAHGNYPETLAATDIAAADATDPFVDRPLVYRRDGAGYLLYSVGPDLTDDGGRARIPNQRRSSTGWDVAVRAAK